MKGRTYVSSPRSLSKSRWVPLFRLPDVERGLDVVVLARGSLTLFCVTGVVEGRREIVGAHMQPAPDGFRAQEWADHVGELRRRAGVIADEFARFPAASLIPITAEVLRSVPIRDVMAYRERDVSERVQMHGALEGMGIATRLGQGELTGDDEKRLAYLDDAVTYVAALAEGRSPAGLIADRRGISKRTAEGRVLKARELGLLTEATGRVASGQLTEDAERLLAFVRNLGG